MAKKRLPLAVFVFSMMMFQANANAFWLDIVKEFVVGGIKTIVMPKAAKLQATAEESKPAPQAAKSDAQPNPEDIFAALMKLQSICNQFTEQLPCAVAVGGKSHDINTSRKKAIAEARIELANTIGTYIEATADLDETSEEDEAGVLKEVKSYIANAKFSTQQLVTNVQPYLSYTFIDEEATQINKGRTVYMTAVVVTMNKDLFGKALEETANKNPLSEQIIKESRKGIVAIVKNVLKRR